MAFTAEYSLAALIESALTLPSIMNHPYASTVIGALVLADPLLRVVGDMYSMEYRHKIPHVDLINNAALIGGLGSGLCGLTDLFVSEPKGWLRWGIALLGLSGVDNIATHYRKYSNYTRYAISNFIRDQNQSAGHFMGMIFTFVVIDSFLL